MELKSLVDTVQTGATGLSRRRRWIYIALCVAIVLAAGGFIVIKRPSLRSTLIAGLVIHVSVWLLRTLWRTEVATWSQQHQGRYRRLRLIALIAIPVVAIGIAVFYWVGRHDHGVALYVAGVGLYVAFGAGSTRWRKRPGRDKRWGPGLIIGATVLGLVCLVVATVNVSVAPLTGVLVALLIYPSGIGLAAEDNYKTDTPATQRLRRAWGVASVAAGLAGLSLAGIGAYQAIVLTIVLVVLVALISSATAHDMVLVLLVLTLVWSLEPKAGDPEPDPKSGTAAHPARTIVALGDSYMSGEGASTFFEGTNHHHSADDRNECRRAPTAYPMKVQQLLAKERESYELLFLACSGAKAKQLTTTPQYHGEPTSSWSGRGVQHDPEGQAQLPQALEAIKALHLEPDIVLISIGGNDAGFGEIGQTCGLAGDCSVMGQSWLTALDSTRAKIRATYEQIRATPEFAASRMLVVPYPIPLNESGCTASLLRPNEHRFLVGFTRALDRVLEEEALRANIDFLSRGVDVFTRPRHRICDESPSKAAVNQLAASPLAGVFLQHVSPRGWFHNTFHPNERGHKLIATEVANWIKPPPPDERPPQIGPSDAPMTLAGIMGAGFDHCASADRAPPTCHADRTSWMIAAMTRVLWAILVPMLLVAFGAWLLSLEAIRRWRS